MTRCPRSATTAAWGARLTNGDNFLLRRVFREIVGTPHLDHRLDARPGSASLEVAWGLRGPLAAIPESSLLLLVGCDITEEYPIAWLRMKQAVDHGAQLYAIHPKPLEIHRFITGRLIHGPGAEGVVLAQIAGAVGGQKPDARVLQAAGVDPAVVAGLGGQLRAAARPMVFIGKSALEGPAGTTVLHAAQRLQAAGCMIHIMRGKGNAVGAALMGVLPGPGGGAAPGVSQPAGRRAPGGPLRPGGGGGGCARPPRPPDGEHPRPLLKRGGRGAAEGGGGGGPRGGPGRR